VDAGGKVRCKGPAGDHPDRRKRVHRGVVRAAAINLWIGVSQAGYSFLEELPIFLVIFGIPAALAVFAGRRLR
jgi:hypothetical protein